MICTDIAKNRRISRTLTSDRMQDEHGPYPTNPSILGCSTLLLAEILRKIKYLNESFVRRYTHYLKAKNEIISNAYIHNRL
jgi:hypothetical protein